MKNNKAKMQVNCVLALFCILDEMGGEHKLIVLYVKDIFLL